LAHLLIVERAVDTLAEHFEDLHSCLDVDNFEAALASSLADALAKRGNLVHAASVAAATAKAFEDSGNENEAVEAFLKAFQWDDSNQIAEDGMKRLAAASGREQQVASVLLIAVAGNDALVAGRVSDAVGLLGAYTDRVIRSAVASVQVEVAALQRDVVSKEESSYILKQEVIALQGSSTAAIASFVSLREEAGALQNPLKSAKALMDSLSDDFVSKLSDFSSLVLSCTRR